MELSGFKKLPIIGILRGIDSEVIEPLVEAVVGSGLKTIEITMNTQGAAKMISKMVRVAAGRLTIGAGTVLTRDDLQSALNAGASFIVSPTLVPEVVEHCAANNICVFPGALTPQEIYDAWRAGATMVKVFPAKLFGPDYFKEIKAPMQEIELLACGGVNASNVGAYLSSGASAVAFGASIFKAQWLKERSFSQITDSTTARISAVTEQVRLTG